MAISGGAQVRVDGLDAALRDIQGVAGRARDFSQAFQRVDLAVGAFFRKRWDSEGGHGGEPWKPLAPSTERARQRSGGNRGGILWDFGNLRASLIKFGPDSIRVIEPLFYERGTSRPGAAAHQEGKGVPRRVIIPDPLPAFLVKEMEKILVDHLEN